MRPYSFRDWLFENNYTRFEYITGLRRAGIALSGTDGDYDSLGKDPIRDVLRLGISFRILPTAASSVDQLVDDMYKAMHRGEKILKIKMEDSTYRMIWAKCRNISVPRSFDLYKLADVRLDFDCNPPYWESASHVWYLDQGDVLDVAGCTFDWNYSQLIATTSGSTLTITNDGTAPIRRGMVQITGSCGSPCFTNTTNDYYVTWAGSLDAGVSLYLDFSAHAAYTDDTGSRSGQWDSIEMPDDQIEMMKLDPGANAITFNACSISSVVVNWWWADTFY